MNPTIILYSLMDGVIDHILLSRCGKTVSSIESTAQMHLQKFIICPMLLITYSYISFPRLRDRKL